ncbi:hypothetical protein BWI97_08830 [Siphonobacter sp. BAB-5405]|uniref:hypothetical protein n=1 Tax=Siphonobacter sp. BAB-5405 TaxID=1864825 RepID=UPI000C8009EC|nr:hypothetical protein [Siphonobacter sp. BAB-5405]PMD97704.1 hypothetical protein BWI97_08830 [Siphonobacter sp. BAB-5405]
MQPPIRSELARQLFKFIIDFDNLKHYTPGHVKDLQAQAREVIEYLTLLHFEPAEKQAVLLCVKRLILTISEADQAFKKLSDPANVAERSKMDTQVWPFVVGGAISALEELIRFINGDN